MSSAVFPSLLGVAWNIQRTVEWQTRTQQAVSGKTTRIADWTYPKYKWQLTYDFLRSDPTNSEYQTLLGFINARQGGFDTFLYTDPDDSSVANQQVGTGDGSTVNFQLVRTLGGFVEPMTAINTVTGVWVNGVAAPSWSIVASTGVLTIGTPPPPGYIVTASFSYYWRVVFTMDTPQFNNFMYKFWELKKLEFETVK